MTSFLFAQTCDVDWKTDLVTYNDMRNSCAHRGGGQMQDWTPSFSNPDKLHCSYNSDSRPDFTMTYKKSFSCPKPDPKPPEMCSSEYCSSADKRRFQNIGDWYENCSTSFSQVVSRQTLNGKYSYTVRFGCREPAQSVDVCYALYDEPKECNPDDDLSPDDESTFPTDDKEVPCFGNVEGCSNGLPPDYVDPGTGIPCWGENCNDSTPPDYVDPNTGVPCWGKDCGLTPPNDSGENGDGTGSNGGNGSGIGTGNGGQGDGGIGSGDGNGSGNWDVPGGGWGASESFDIPDTFWNQQNKETIRDKYDREIRMKNPYDFNSINTDIGVGSCPKFETEIFGDVSPPCWFWDLVGNMFMFLSTLTAFTILFWRR